MEFDWEVFRKGSVLVHCTSTEEYNNFCNRAKGHIYEFRTSTFHSEGNKCDIYCHMYRPYLNVKSVFQAEQYNQFEWSDYMTEDTTISV